jgi:uncharacterized protein (DUF983 family)
VLSSQVGAICHLVSVQSTYFKENLDLEHWVVIVLLIYAYLLIVALINHDLQEVKGILCCRKLV